MTEVAIHEAKKGMPFECILAQAVMRYASLHPQLFPHAVLHAYVQRCAVYIVYKITKGKMSHAVRYMHGFSTMTKTFDSISKAQFESRFKGLGFLLNLNPGRVVRVGESTVGGNSNGNRSRSDGSRSLKTCRGAAGRAKAAGLIPGDAVLEDA
jgi:hypothetical protein